MRSVPAGGAIGESDRIAPGVLSVCAVRMCTAYSILIFVSDDRGISVPKSSGKNIEY